MPYVNYTSRKFPKSFGIKGTHQLDCTWSEIVWAALTVGKNNLFDSLVHYINAFLELIYRGSIVLGSITEDNNSFITKTFSYKELDPSEKTSISYFIAITFAKLLVERKLNFPSSLHIGNDGILVELGKSWDEIIRKQKFKNYF